MMQGILQANRVGVISEYARCSMNIRKCLQIRYFTLLQKEIMG